MRLHHHLLAPLQRFFPSAPATLHSPAENNRRLHATGQGIGHFLGLDEEATAKLAQASLAQHQTLRARRPAAPALGLRPAQERLDGLLQQGACLLALPFNGPALLLLQQLASQTDLPLLLIESPLLRAALPDLGLAWPTLARCASQDVIRHVKAARVLAAAPTLYVSFPELHAHDHGTSATRPFMERPCHFSLLEAVLLRSGLQNLATLGLDGAGPQVQLVSRSAQTDSAGDAGQAIGATLDWLVAQLQAVAGHWPAQTLSWQYLYRASVACQEIERSNQLKQLEAFFDAWKRADAGLAGDTYGFAMARLSALRNAQ